MARRLRRWCVAVGIIAGTVLVSAGRLNDPWLWTYIASWAAVFLYALVSLDDDVAKERFSPPEPGADARWLHVIRLVALAHLVVGALDSGRFHWSPVDPVLRVAGLVGVAASLLLMVRAMLTNRFFSSVVRIQSDRGHRVVDAGPYAIVRHPGYAGMILMGPLSGLALGSWISVAIALVYSGLILRRVFFEDAFLRRNLDGYDAYSRRVRYRLVPRLF